MVGDAVKYEVERVMLLLSLPVPDITVSNMAVVASGDWVTPPCDWERVCAGGNVELDAGDITDEVELLLLLCLGRIFMLFTIFLRAAFSSSELFFCACSSAALTSCNFPVPPGCWSPAWRCSISALASLISLSALHFVRNNMFRRTLSWCFSRLAMIVRSFSSRSVGKEASAGARLKGVKTEAKIWGCGSGAALN